MGGKRFGADESPAGMLIDRPCFRLKGTEREVEPYRRVVRKYIMSHLRIKVAIAGKHISMPDMLADDEEERFVKREGLNDVGSLSRITSETKKFNKSEVWEPHKTVCMTAEVSYSCMHPRPESKL